MIAKRRETTPKFLLLMIVIYGLMVIYQSTVVVYTPHTFVRVLNLLAIVVLSAITGAFIREIFVLKGNKNREEIE